MRAKDAASHCCHSHQPWSLGRVPKGGCTALQLCLQALKPLLLPRALGLPRESSSLFLPLSPPSRRPNASSFYLVSVSPISTHLCWRPLSPFKKKKNHPSKKQNSVHSNLCREICTKEESDGRLPACFLDSLVSSLYSTSKQKKYKGPCPTLYIW